MPNRAYASVWLRDFNQQTMLSYWREFLGTVPVDGKTTGITELIIRAIDSTETPLQEYDLRGQPLALPDVFELARDYESSDVALEVWALWEIWIRDLVALSWQKRPERLTIFCFGPEYDNGTYAESGHLLVDLGLEHLFTGHAGLLTANAGEGAVAEPQHPEEARFLMWMSQPKNLREYQEKTRENIEQLMGWMRKVEETLPVERVRLWSEGEENFEARLDEILAVR